MPAALRTDHFALLISGSTGQPKLVIGKKQRSEALARVLHDCQGSEPVERTLYWLWLRPQNYPQN